MHPVYLIVQQFFILKQRAVTVTLNAKFKEPQTLHIKVGIQVTGRMTAYVEKKFFCGSRRSFVTRVSVS